MQQKSNRAGGVHSHCTLIVEQLPGFVDQEMLYGMFGRYGEITSLKLTRTGPDCNDAYVSYANKRDAERAVERCNGTKLCGATIYVKLLRPEPSSVGQQQCTIKITRIPPHVTEEELKCAFSAVGVVKSVHKTAHGYAYVNFYNPEDANYAVERYDGSNMFGASNISVKIKMPTTAAPVSIGSPSASTLPSLPDQKAPTLPPAPSTSVTLKVSIQVEKVLNLTIEDLLMALDKYGTITQHSEIKPGTPPYAYINFTTPEEARAACELNGMILKGHYIKIKIVNKEVVNIDIREIPCLPPIGQLLLCLHGSELQDMAVKMAPNKPAIQVSGKASEMGAIERKVQLLIEKVKKVVTKVTKSLPCHHLPSFGTPQIIAMINKIEEDHMVRITVLDTSGKTLNVADVLAEVSLILQANPRGGVAEASHLSSFLHHIPADGDVWFWHEVEKRRYTPYKEETSKKLTEHCLKEPWTPYILDVETGCYKIDFIKMTQTNIVTKYKRDIKYGPPGSAGGPSIPTKPTSKVQAIKVHTLKQPPGQIRIEIQGIHTYLEAAFTNLRDELEKWLIESKLCIEPSHHNTALYTINHYCVEAAEVEMDLVIKGNKEYVAKVIDKVRKVVQKEQSKFLDQTVPDRPNLWTEKAMLAPVDELSFEWRDVVPLLHKTLPDAKVSKLQIIQNDKLLERYASAKKRMSAKNGAQQVNEQYLFYGTADISPEHIYNTTGINQWGSSLRFAVNASYSNTYAYRLGKERCLIVARVLTGRLFYGPPDQMMRHLSKSAHGGTSVGELYDSVTESTQGSVIYVINDHENAYPAYLVTYIV
ncbi:hypothetical protein EMCRGX_G013321 [Ephydatia muelleri]